VRECPTGAPQTRGGSEVSIAFSDFERWALSVPVPCFGLPAQVRPTDADLWRRAVEISFDLIRKDEGEKGLAAILVQLGALDYLEESLCR
jgi:hypothetical protein